VNFVISTTWAPPRTKVGSSIFAVFLILRFHHHPAAVLAVPAAPVEAGHELLAHTEDAIEGADAIFFGVL
jgi:hypothetical protein